MRKALILTLLFLLAGCSTVGLLGELPMPDGSKVYYVHGASKGFPLIGKEIRFIDRYQYDPSTNKTTFVRGDSTGGDQRDVMKIPIPSIPGF